MIKYVRQTALFLSSICIFISCTPDNESQTATNQQNNDFADMAHNSRNSVDWTGTYRGITPCADCEGIDTEMVLHEDGRYEIATVYLGKSDEVFRESGSFTWSEDGSRIQLDVTDGSRSPNYLVGENHIVHLDMDGNRVTGALADYYILDKHENPLTDRYWKLTALNNIPIDSSQTGPKEPHIILHPQESNASGTGGCNSLAANYQISGENSISFSQVISTKMACQDAAYEMDFIQLLEATASYSLREDTLVLISSQGDSTLQFIEQPEFN